MRSMSATAIAAMMGSETNEVFHVLVQITHADLSTIRLVNNTEDVTSDGDVYTAYPFEISFPQEDGNTLPRASLRINNVDQLLTAAIRSIGTPPSCQVDIVLASDPDTVEAGPWNFEMRDAVITSEFLVFELTFEPILQEKFPKYTMSPIIFPALFTND